ncbi:MAG TPA: hypothetical protein VK570_19100 [Rubrivivax sp.]|nr:hypothetical protein [Rubrivivax sp.]
MAGKPGAGTRLLTVALLMLLQACIVVPQIREAYDPECRVQTRQVTLEAAVLGHFHGCQGRGCEVMLASAGLVTAASTVVSGSIAMVGNVLYWFEKQGRCLGPAAR